ncbi:class I SAM-dependent methyltransferase [Isoptericola sp. NEAU-Y5]|uniref:Class I SAM-dependent methyltransferase n=1 Tax=Isoptericola luteus TaxID=2879484 RepID=A0ABS7ZCE9_9MICO|nr:class I SAM-dependent methyltransferase [Isoptericola sp. NEAU-Y5]MCA5892726.1 class I SAM-dependent methyltransferase [Isoptericola sp. NEAU-Y5]
MRSRSFAALVATAVAVAVGVVAALLGRTDVALAVVVVLLGSTALLTVQVYRRTGAAAVGARAAGREVGRLRKELARRESAVPTATAVHRDAAAARASVAKLDDLASQIGELREEVTAVHSLAHAARPGKLLSQIQALDQLRDKFRVEGPLPDVGGWALDPTELLWLIDEVERRRPEFVVECGSGTSTFWIAMALRRNGHGRIISLEHQGKFAARTRAVLERHELSDVAEVRHAPLAEVETPRGTFRWYDVEPDSLGPIDLLVVDGPPGTTGPLARYPALPVLHRALNPGACVLVDDMHRTDEQEAVRHWLRELPALHRAGYTNGNSEVLTYG